MTKHTIYNSDIDYSEEYFEEERNMLKEMRATDEVSDEEVYESLNRSKDYEFDDELCNLKKALNGRVLAIADLGLWNGRRQGYKLGTNLLSECLTIGNEDSFELYYDGYNVRKTSHHHDGTNYILFREVRPNVNIDKFCDMIYNGEEISSRTLNYYTKSLRPYVKSVYGW